MYTGAIIFVYVCCMFIIQPIVAYNFVCDYINAWCVGLVSNETNNVYV